VVSRFAAGVTDHLRGSSAPRPGWKARVQFCRALRGRPVPRIRRLPHNPDASASRQY